MNDGYRSPHGYVSRDRLIATGHSVDMFIESTYPEDMSIFRAKIDMS